MMQKADKTIKASDSSLMEAELIHAFGKSASNKLRAIGLVAGPAACKEADPVKPGTWEHTVRCFCFCMHTSV